MSAYDYVIAGGGTAACVAAMRLVKEHGARVLILERGPAKTARLMRMPAGYMKYLARDDFLEMHRTAAQPRLGGRAPIVPQAKALGGGSAVNAMVYMRGQREDYDGWDAHLGGGSGWAYEDLLPHFRALERNTKFNDRYHGIDGGLLVSDPGALCDTTQDYLLTAQGMGIPLNPDFNGARQAGVGVMQHTMGLRNGRMERCDAVTAFIADLLNDRRLTIVTGAQVDRVLFEGGRAVGLSYRVGGQAKTVNATREVLLAAGTYNTAKLMMLSGLGPADHLREHGIDVRADLPGLGSSLQDHHEVPVIATTKGPSGYFGQDKGWPMVRNGLQYMLFASGPVTTTGIESCLFYDPDGGERPTIQLYCAPIVYLDRDVSSAKPSHGVTLTSCLLRPKARGTVRLRSGDPDAMPLVDSNFFGDPDDLRLTVASLRFAREVLASRPLSDRIRDELLPGRDVTDDAGLEAFCGKTVKTNYHPVGSAPMGPDDDPMAVLDASLRVRGVEGLRVIDCSAMPMIPSGNTNAPVMALASRAVDLIAGVSQERGAAA
ncbi:GMC family oxidoreductase N-terminal domain-containing protein [Aureimonas sp. Leaf324]|uniref:GMC family oxidoreductase n=1 Tax=Aureimonas sp. Leaf324 TaxID=1736336 RepID=UPI0006F6C866|nr:GMC family oxidoreductase N-terminal domain-containing protein [Aureimonas sp. Leaf324]KQQ88212.1 sorbosone dehydrogenase [Aureimonas sp. Leaf324]